MTTAIDSTRAINGLYMLFCSALLPLVVIGVACFYSGLTQRRSSMTMLALPVMLLLLVMLDWFIWGYSLCYSTSSNRFIGNLDFVVLRQLRDSINEVYINRRGEILSLNHFMFNGLFKVICTAITFPGCIAERGRLLPMLVFLFFWSCIIYNPVTYWFWNKNGWLSVDLNIFPVLDFAGGTCIHIVGGFTTLAYSYILGHRNPKVLVDYRNSNTGFIIIGTLLITLGWVGFISGCDFQFSTTSLFIFVNTLLSACAGGVTWGVIDFYFSAMPLDGTSENKVFEEVHKITATLSRSSRNVREFANTLKPFIKRKASMISFCSGVIAALVAYTPGGGYIASPSEFWKSILFGVIGSVICNISTRLKYFFGIDDALDIFAIHGVAGIVGSLLTGIFANKSYGAAGGWIQRNWIQLAYQVLGCVVTAAYVFILSCFFLYIIDIIPGLHLRIDKSYNKRVRKLNQMKKSTTMDSELQSTSANIEVNSDDTFGETLELLGTDYCEFGEYMNDYVEFIKVIRPDDFVSELDSEGTRIEDIGHTSDFAMIHENKPHQIVRDPCL